MSFVFVGNLFSSPGPSGSEVVGLFALANLEGEVGDIFGRGREEEAVVRLQRSLVSSLAHKQEDKKGRRWLHYLTCEAATPLPPPMQGSAAVGYGRMSR